MDDVYSLDGRAHIYILDTTHANTGSVASKATGVTLTHLTFMNDHTACACLRNDKHILNITLAFSHWLHSVTEAAEL